MKITKPTPIKPGTGAAGVDNSVRPGGLGAELGAVQEQLPDYTRDVFGGQAERFGVFLKQQKSEVGKLLEAEIAKLALGAVKLADHTEGAGTPAHGVVRGVASGVLVRTAVEAKAAIASGTPFILMLRTIHPETIAFASKAAGLIIVGRKAGTERLAEALGRPAVRVTPSQIGELPTQLTIDGTAGKVLKGHAAVVHGSGTAEMAAGIDALRQRFGLTVSAQASTVDGIATAKLHGADKIRVDGNALVSQPRTLAHLRRYLLETEAAPKKDALEHLIALSREDARGLMDASDGTPMTFVLGDGAPHGFFPTNPADLDALASQMGLPKQLVRDRVGELGGGNSKLGLRGARWAVKDPDLFAAWARAVFEAWADKKEAGEAVGPLRLHLPNVALGSELGLVKEKFEAARKAVESEYGLAIDVSYSAGVDTARGALSTDEISVHADALEYAAAELTETLYAIPRDDAEQYLPVMQGQGLIPADPFEQIDVDAVGKMIRVGQFLAGDGPNVFPASLSGPQALTANGMFVAAQSGITEIVVPAHSALTARVLHARTSTALKEGTGSVVPKSELRDQGARLFDHLLRRNDGAKPSKVGGIPADTTALEHVEKLEKMVEAGALTSADALLQVPANIVDQLSKPVIDPKANVAALAKGIAASPGCGQGKVALSKEAAAEFEKAGEPYVLIVNEVHADEVEATRKSAGLVSVRGGKTSHAAMIASNSDVPCVMQEKVQINLETKTAQIGKTKVQEGDWVTIDGTKGQILPGKVPLLNPTKSTAFASLMKWADEHRTMEVLANADTPAEATTAFARGAQGVGLVRSEHMFYEADRLKAFRAVILSDMGKRPKELADLEQAQVDDYTALFVAAGDKKVGVRLLDPPLYEFVPQKREEIEDLAKLLGISSKSLLERINDKAEVDSMLGMRGVRLALTRPDIEAMQVRALARAYVAASKQGACAPLHIIVPQVSLSQEMEAAKVRILAVVSEVEADAGIKIPVKLGSMIETPRAALEASAIAEHVDFFSYGTNDLTQGTLGYGRNVAAKFIPELIKAGALDADPTESLDEKGVIKLIKVAESLGNDTNPDLYGGVCGGQAGDPRSIDALQKAGVKYISVSPGQVAKARLAAGQSAVKLKEGIGEPDRPAGLFKSIADQLGRALSVIKTVPTTAADAAAIEYLELQVRDAAFPLRVGARTQQPLADRVQLMKMVSQARELLDANKLAQALHGEVSALERRVADLKAPLLATAKKELDVAREAAKAFGATITAQIGQPRSTGGERAAASHAWAALRAFEAVRGVLVQGGALPAAHEHNNRLWHHNDGWDNQHYTKRGPNDGESMIGFMKRAALDFCKDNDLSVMPTGFEFDRLPKDRPIVLAVTHRSGAIDRFVTMSVLPFENDEMMYVVRKGSPYDQIASENFAAEDNPVLAPESAQELSEKAIHGFKNGKRVLLTYPQGTGSIVGESRFPATSTVRLALEAGALIVPVTLHDSWTVRPFAGGSVDVQMQAPIDPLELAQRAKAEGLDPADVIHAELHYALSKGYRAEI